MEQVFADFLLPQLGGWAHVVCDEVVHASKVVVAGGGLVGPELEIFRHSVMILSHDRPPVFG